MKISPIVASFDVAPDDTVPDVIVIVSAVESYVQAKVLDTELSLPVPSLNVLAETEIEVAPSVVGVKVAV